MASNNPFDNHLNGDQDTQSGMQSNEFSFDESISEAAICPSSTFTSFPTSDSVNAESNDEYIKPQRYADLPEFILLKIFSYLPSAVEIVRAGRVCFRWHTVSQEESLWKCVTVSGINLTPHKIYKLFQVLPSCVSYLKITNCLKSSQELLFNNENGSKLKENHPNLETLIIEDVLFNLKPNNADTDFTIDCLPPNTSVLSFQRSVLIPKFFFIEKSYCNNIVVIDLSFCKTLRDHPVFFTKMPNLKELYLAGCSIDDSMLYKMIDFDDDLVILHNFLLSQSLHHIKLSAALKWKVLDLEDNKVSDSVILFLLQKSPFLEKLYLSRTNIECKFICDFPDFLPFPPLTHLCLKYCSVSFSQLLPLACLKSIKYIDIVSNDLKGNVSELDKHLKEKFRFHDEVETFYYCNHFMKRNAI